MSANPGLSWTFQDSWSLCISGVGTGGGKVGRENVESLCCIWVEQDWVWADAGEGSLGTRHVLRPGQVDGGHTVEGPCRMRKRLQWIHEFFKQYPFQPHLPSVVSLGFKYVDPLPNKKSCCIKFYFMHESTLHWVSTVAIATCIVWCVYFVEKWGRVFL